MSLLQLTKQAPLYTGNDLLYLIGVPGAGKTTLVRATFGEAPYTAETKPFAHCVYRPGCVMLGKERGVFSGTDALSMSVSPLVLKAFQELDWDSVFGEGDRLATESFFTAVQNLGWKVKVVLLDTPDELAADRRAARGTTQDPTWVQGRVTKVRRLAERFASVRLDGTKTAEELAVKLRGERVIQAMLRGSKS